MSEPRRRWPGSVYEHGTEPDPRFSLANERTFLAWIRTGLALLAGAAALDALDLPLPDSLQAILAALLGLAAVLVVLAAFRGWARTERAMREEAPLPGNPAMLVALLAVVLVAVVIGVESLLRGLGR
jgi:putative membrane protein